MSKTVADLMENACLRHTEELLGVKLTKRQFNAYIRAMERQEHQDELNRAIYTLENAGYKVIPPKETP